MSRLVLLFALLLGSLTAAAQPTLLECTNTEECCLRRNPALPELCGVDARRASIAVDEAATAGTVLLATAIDGGALDSYLVHIASHLALILALEQVGDIPPGKPPEEQTNNHWWREVKAAVKNIRQVLKKCRSRRQLLAALGKVPNARTAAQLADIEARLVEAARKMGEKVDELLPCRE